MQYNQRRKTFDPILIGSTIILIAAGLLALYSATHGSQTQEIGDNFSRQVIWVIIGLAISVITAVVPTKLVEEGSFVIFGLCLLPLLVVLFAKGSFISERWLTIGGISWQPSEFAKLGLILALARYLGEPDRSPKTPRTMAITFAITLLPFLLVAQQPDLATAAVFFVVLISMLYWAGLDSFILFVIATPLLVFVTAFNFYTFSAIMIVISVVLYISKRGAVVFWSVFLVNILVGIFAPVFWSQLRSYQQQRVLTFLGLVSDPQGVGYQIIQSKVAIGSGGLFGKGFMQGTQTQLRFLPAQHTDFVISVLAEEFGFIFIFLIMLVILVFLIRSVKIASTTKDKFSSLTTIGCVSVLTFQIFVNLGMATGLVPVAGIPLPFLSYGGSSLVVSMMMVGLIHNTACKQ